MSMLLTALAALSWLETAVFLQANDNTGTPFWVILLILMLMVLIFWWGLTRNQIEEQAPADAHAHPTPSTAGEHRPEPTAVQIDELQRIEGIGPQIKAILNEAGITTFAQLAQADLNILEQIVREDAGITIADPTTWPEQAALAAAGQWQALENLQMELSGGRR